MRNIRAQQENEPAGPLGLRWLRHPIGICAVLIACAAVGALAAPTRIMQPQQVFPDTGALERGVENCAQSEMTFVASEDDAPEKQIFERAVRKCRYLRDVTNAM